MEKKYKIGKKIKEKRLELNLRMDDVAKEIGITRATLWSIENGDGNYTIDTFLKLLDLLNINLDIDTKDNKNDRRRATRANTILDKKINRFIVMCVEQYASYVNQGSSVVYKKLNDLGIIKELKDDYEDMHGMSVYLLNEYIDKRIIGEGK
ncbi:MAG: helix-turn-helix domain-containing protein [Clostridia bacterium]|nr:helix-turn-helix domain-containing protein [Clostridia bacterium]